MSASSASDVHDVDAVSDVPLASVRDVVVAIEAGARRLRIQDGALDAQMAAELSGAVRADRDLWVVRRPPGATSEARLRAVGPIARRALAGVRRDIVASDVPGSYPGAFIVADATAVADWVTDVDPGAPRPTAVRVGLDPFLPFLSPVDGSVRPLVVATHSGASVPSRHERLLVGAGFSIEDVRVAVEAAVEPVDRPVLVLDEPLLDNRMDAAVGVLAAASLCVPAVMRQPLGAVPYLGDRTLAAVRRRAEEDVRTSSARGWHLAAAELRAAAVSEHTLGAVLQAAMPGRIDGPPQVSLVVPDGAQSGAVQVLTSALVGQAIVEGRAGERLREAARDADVEIVELGSFDPRDVVSCASADLVTAVIPGADYAANHVDALVGIARHAGSGRVRGGVASVRVRGLGVELGGPFDAFPAASMLVPKAELAIAAQVMPGGVLRTLIELAAGGSYAPTMSVTVAATPESTLAEVGPRTFDDSGQWPRTTHEV